MQHGENVALKQSHSYWGKKIMMELREVSKGDVLILPHPGKTSDVPKVRVEASGPAELNSPPTHPQYDLEEDLGPSHSSAPLCDLGQFT